MIRFKSILKYIVVVGLLIYSGIQTYRFLRIEWSGMRETRCGTVTFKGNRDQVNKSSSTTEFVLVILYDDTNRKEDESVSAATWSSTSVGEKICLSWDANGAKMLGGVNGVVGLIGAGIFCIGLVVLGIAIIAWFFWDTNIFDKKHWVEYR